MKLPLPDLLLEASRVLIGLGLAVFVGVPLARLFGRMTRAEARGERADAQNGKEIKKKIFLEGEEGEREWLGRAKFVAAGALLVGLLLEAQVMGSALPPRHMWRAVAIFLLLAALVSAVMVVLPRERYYRGRSLALEENLRQPWANRADAARRRAARLDFVGFLLAVAALILG